MKSRLTSNIPDRSYPAEPSGFYAGIVLYHPDGQHYIESIFVLLSCGINVILFDNSEDRDTKDNNKNIIIRTFGDQLRCLEASEGNIGLAAAFNRIVHEVSNDRLAKGLFFFDQDTDVNVDALEYLLDSFFQLQMHGRLGVLSGYAMRENGIAYRIRPRSSYVSPSPSLIATDVTSSSFSVIPIETLLAVGRFQDDFFIDYIDGDFCNRCWQQNLPVFVDKRATFWHRVGLGDVYFGNKPLFPIATPFRHYYQMRNMILSHTRANVSPFTIVKDIVLRITVVFVIGIYTCSLFQRLKFTVRGIIDGIQGKGGRL